MTSHFNFKSLTFYGVAIGGVLLLFNVVSAYGETKLKAPVAIGGRYRLSLAQNLPTCPKSDALMLNIEQSGIYLNGFISAADTDAQKATGKEKPSLTGKLSNQQLSLVGTLASTFCNNPGSQPEATSSFEGVPSSWVTIQSRVEGKNLEGTMTLSGISKAIGFTAQRETPVKSPDSSSH